MSFNFGLLAPTPVRHYNKPMQILKDFELSSLTTERTFPTRFCGDSRHLQSSVQTFGILHPPRLYEENGTLTILDGFERLRIAREMGTKQVACFIYDASQLSLQNAFLLCLELNRLSRPFNMVEKAQLLKASHQVFSGTNIPKAFWSLIEIPHNIRSVQQFKDLLTLPPVVQKYAINNNTSLATILGFLNFRPENIDKLASQLFLLPLNQNKLADILSLLRDISQKEEKSALLVLEEILPEIELEFSPHNKEQKLRQLLHQRRNPNYEKRLADFEDHVKKLPINDKTKVQPAPFFEADYVEVTTKFYNQEDVNEFIDTLKDGSWNEILKDTK